MATFEQEEAVKTELKQVLNGLSQINAKDLIRANVTCPPKTVPLVIRVLG
ncbi:MAG: hypothetical protein M0Z70_12400 [Nitrospiraceae bacterium]|jgi:hypothetical protein|nr:hypothetical protein [Nitrospiraceae bacterium]